MNVKGLADKYVENYGGTKKDAREVINNVVHVICDALIDEGEVNIPECFKLSVAVRSARQGHNPKTGETIEIPARRVLKVTAAKQFRDTLND